MEILKILPILVTVFFSVILLLTLLVEILKGRSKGLFPTLMRIVFIILSAIFAALLSPVIGRLIGGALVSKIGELISQVFPAYGDVIAMSPTAEAILASVPASIISVVLYIFFFIIFHLLMLIPKHIITKQVFERFFPNMPKIRWAGALCGTIAGVAMFVCITAPLCGTLDFVGDVGVTVSSLAQKDEDAQGGEGFDIYEDVIEPTSNNFYVKFTSVLGGRPIYNRLTVLKIDGEKVSVSRELDVLADVLSSVKPMMGEKGMASLKRENIDTLASASGRLPDTKIVSGLLADILSGAAKKWEAGESFLGISVSAGEGSSADFLKEFLIAFKGTTKATVGEDIGTLAGVLGILYDNGMLETKNGASMTDSLKNDGFISKLLEAVMKNERFSGTAASIINLGVKSTLDTLGVPENSEAVYDNFVSDVANIVNSQPSEEKLAQKTYDSFEAHGVKTDKRVTDLTASYLDKQFGDRTDVTSEEITAFFAVAFAEKAVRARGPIAESAASELCGELSALKDDASINWEALGSIASREDFITSALTYETITVTKNALSAIGAEKLGVECDKVEEMIRKFLYFSDSSKGVNAIESGDVASLGSALNIIGESAILGEISEDMIRAIFSSKLVRDHIKISDSTIENMIASHETDYENILVSVQKTTGIINGLGKQEDKISDEELDEKLEYLLDDMSQNTADVIGEVFDSENVQKLGVEEEKADKMADSLGVFFDKMANSDADTSNPEDKDVKASKAVFKFMAASKTNTDNVFEETGLTPDETVKTFMDSEISRETIIEASYSEDGVQMDSFGLAGKLDDNGRNEALASMEEHVKENYENEEDKEQYEKTVIAIGALLGMDVSDDLASWIN